MNKDRNYKNKRQSGHSTMPTRKAGSQRGEESRRWRKRRPPVALSIVLDFIAAALLLGIFYIMNYRIKTEVKPVALPTPAITATPTSSGVMPTIAPMDSRVTDGSTDNCIQTTPAATIDPNDWRTKYADQFTNGEIEQTARSYKSANIYITIEEIDEYDAPCFIADIYVADLKYFKSAFAEDPDVMGAAELTNKVAEENDAILAINGDHCVNNPGTVVRNGQMYREEIASADVLVMNYDGSMQTFSPDEFDVEKIKLEGVYQVWSFGPMLLQEGQPMTKFNTTVARSNPRTAVGYYEPGHYCFVVVGGRHEDYAQGYTMEQLSQLMYDLGCTEAYNLDGGRSSEMIFLGNMLNQQSPRRSTTEILYIADE